jgi:D-amino-acid dehydrogenase
MDPDLWRWTWRFCQSANADHVARAAPLLRDLHLESRRLYEALAEELDDFGYTERGIVQLCKTEQGLNEETETGKQAERLGIPAHPLTPAECRKLEPNVRLTVAGGVYYPKDAHLSPEKLVASLERALRERGVQFRWSEEVIGFSAGPHSIEGVKTRNETLPADAFVLAAGSWSSPLMKTLGMRLPMMGGRGYSLTLPQPPVTLTTPALLIEARVAVTPMGTSLRFGGTMEIVRPDVPENPARVRGIVKSIPDYLPDFSPKDFRQIPAWSGYRPLSPDGMPYVGAFRRYPNLYAATGHAMMGVSLAPITGHLLADLISDSKPALDIQRLAPDRFG